MRRDEGRADTRPEASPALRAEREVNMGIGATRDALSRIFFQRCFWLFAVLVMLIGAVSFVPANDHGRLFLNGVNMFLLIATVAAVGRTTLSFAIALLLAVPAVWFQYLGLWHDSDADLTWSWIFSATLYSITTAYLLRYVFQPRIMTQDKLFGAAAAYLMIGVLWAYLYAIIGFFYPQSYLIVGQPGRLVYADALYLSITVLTSTGFGDVTPLTRQARGICMIEQITGALFVAILIARLAGVYPRRESYVDDKAP
jgi:Ion channel